jgi:hypothetical protein
MRDGRDDVFESGGGPKKTVTIVTDRHGVSMIIKIISIKKL